MTASWGKPTRFRCTAILKQATRWLKVTPSFNILLMHTGKLYPVTLWVLKSVLLSWFLWFSFSKSFNSIIQSSVSSPTLLIESRTAHWLENGRRFASGCMKTVLPSGTSFPKSGALMKLPKESLPDMKSCLGNTSVLGDSISWSMCRMTMRTFRAEAASVKNIQTWYPFDLRSSLMPRLQFFYIYGLWILSGGIRTTVSVLSL